MTTLPTFEPTTTGRPGAGAIRVRLGAVGLDYGDAVGTIDAVGADTAGFAPKDRVAWRIDPSRLALRGVLRTDDLIGVPKNVPDEKAAALLTRGLIARLLLRQINAVGRGDTVVVDERGRIGSVVGAWARGLGARVVAPGEPAPHDAVTLGEGIESVALRPMTHGLAQQGAVDVFQAIRRGIFDDVPMRIEPVGTLLDPASSDLPVVLTANREPFVQAA